MCVIMFDANASKTEITVKPLENVTETEFMQFVSYKNVLRNKNLNIGVVNTMILSLPSTDITSFHLYETDELNVLKEFSKIVERNTPKSRGFSVDNSSKFLENQDYTCYLCKTDNFSDTDLKVLNSIGLEVDMRFINWFQENQPNRLLLFAVSKKDGEMEHFAFRFKNQAVELGIVDSPMIYVPMLDAHGELPKNEMVDADHVIYIPTNIVGDYNEDLFIDRGDNIYNTYNCPTNDLFDARYFIAEKLDYSKRPNGDLYLGIEYNTDEFDRKSAKFIF